MQESFGTLKFSVTDHVAMITLCRPDAMNSYNREMGEDLEKLTDAIRLDDSIRAVILNGDGGLFMAGGDICFFFEEMDKMPQGVRKLVRTLNASIMNLMQMNKPVLASVHGSVAGVGMSLMLACDLVIAADDTKFTMAYSGIGISPDGGASWQLPRHVGPKKAMEWLLFSEVFDARIAHTQGLLNWIVPAVDLATQSLKIAKRLASGPSKAYAHCKRLVNETWQSSLEAQLECEGKRFEDCSRSIDFKSGVTGFLDKKVPVFEGR